MPEQYVATDKRTGFEVQVTGAFPEHPDDRMRIARTTQLFTRLMSTLLDKDETARRLGFRAVETQLELADALIRQDHDEVRRLIRETLGGMGVDEDMFKEIARRISETQGFDPHLAQELARTFGLGPEDHLDPSAPTDQPDPLNQLDPAVLEAIEEAMSADDQLEPEDPDNASDTDANDPLDQPDQPERPQS